MFTSQDVHHRQPPRQNMHLGFSSDADNVCLTNVCIITMKNGSVTIIWYSAQCVIWTVTEFLDWLNPTVHSHESCSTVFCSLCHCLHMLKIILYSHVT